MSANNGDHPGNRVDELPGLPQALEAERYILGSLLLDGSRFAAVSGQINAEDLSIEKNRRILLRMQDIFERGDVIDTVMLANELMRHNQLESVDGMGYLMELTEGLPRISNIEVYCRLVGEKSRLRKLAFLGSALTQRAVSEAEGPEALAEWSSKALMDISAYREKSRLRYTRQVVEDAGINAIMQPHMTSNGIPTGFKQFDDMTGGLQRGELAILGGRPASGKTSLAMNMAQHAATRPEPFKVSVFALEMQAKALVQRLLCSWARVDAQRFKLGYLNADERSRLRKALDTVMKVPILIDDTATTSVTDIHGKLMRQKQEEGHAADLTIVDMLQLMGGNEAGKGRETRAQMIGTAARQLKTMAKQLNTAMLVLSSLNRGTETRGGDGRPVLSDLKESGDIESHADLVAFVYREELYTPNRPDLAGLAELIVRKQRNGPIGTVKLVFLKEFSKFENRASDVDYVDVEQGRFE